MHKNKYIIQITKGIESTNQVLTYKIDWIIFNVYNNYYLK